VYVLCYDDVILKVRGRVLGCCVVSGCILVGVYRQNSYEIQLYEETGGKVISECVKKLKVPVDSSVADALTSETTQIKILTTDAVKQNATLSSTDELLINGDLFRQLFDVNVCLLQSPIVVIGLPGGVVLGAPLNHFETDNSSLANKCITICQLSDHISSIFTCDYSSNDIEQADTVYSFKRLNEETKHKYLPVLGVCDASGNILLLHDKPNSEACGNEKLKVSTGVSSVVTYKNKMFVGGQRFLEQYCLEISNENQQLFSFARRYRFSYIRHMNISVSGRYNRPKYIIIIM